MRRREFRSDTMTRPSQAMRDSMRDAEVGDDVCGEDPTVNRLEELGAELLGKEASLFVPSGAFGNQCSIGVQVGLGDEIIVAESSHVVDHETGAAAALWGAQTRVIKPAGTHYPTVEDIAPRIRVNREDVHEPFTGLIVLENALSYGTVMPLEEMVRVRELADEHRVPIHLDGARLFNAALALGVEAVEIAALADTVMICLAKGLGAPVGSLIAGSAGFVKKARKRRKMMGGGMRQVGVIAAPGIVALTDGLARLHEDHDNAALLGKLISEIPGMEIELDDVQTNMVICRVNKEGRTEQGLSDHLNSDGFKAYPPHWWGLRFVTSLEVNEDDVRALAAAIATYMKQ